MSNKKQIYIMIIICIVLFIVSFLSFKFYFLNYSEPKEPNLMTNTQPINITKSNKTNEVDMLSDADLDEILRKEKELDNRAFDYAEAMLKEDIEKGIIRKGNLTLEEIEKSGISWEEHGELQRIEEKRLMQHRYDYARRELEKRLDASKK